MSVLQIRLFGGLALAWDSAPIPPIPSVKARALLAYLVTYRQQRHTRDLLAGTFWPELPDDAARRRLSQAAWQIRHSFEPHPIIAIEADTLQLAPGLPAWVDLEEFTKGYAQAISADPQALGNCETCIQHYRGEFLAGYYEDWILAERERLRNMYLAVLGRLVAGYKSQGQYEKALAHARTLLSEEPWFEEGHREVMRLYHLLGRNAEAHRQYQLCRQVLLDELGIEPSPETQALAAELDRQAGLKDAPWLPVAARASQIPLLEHPDRLPLVGRKAELASILSLVETAASGEGGLMLLYGEAGIGKTRLLRELARNAQWRGIHIAWGRCYELVGPPAYQPLVEILRADLPALHASALEPLWRAELARFLPELATGKLPAALNPEEEQQRLLQAIAHGFQALSASPFLVMLEDAHWMDPASLSAIRYLLPRLADMPLFILISARKTELSGQQAEAFTALENTRIPRSLELSRLSLEETGELVQRCLDLEQPPALFSARLFAETQGNPFFLIETLRALLDEGLLYLDQQGRWSTPWDETTSGYAEMPLPGGVAQSIERRLERLPEPLRETLSIAAVIGRGVPFDLWRQASDLPTAELLAAGDDLCQRGLLLHGSPDLVANAESAEDYTFAHDQIRRVTYNRMSPPRARFYHRRVAEALERLNPGKIEALAYHWTAGAVWDKAVDCHQAAGERAWAVYANAEAIEHYNQALEMLERLPGAPDLARQYEIRLALEKIYDLQGARQLQTQELVALERLAEALDDDRRRAEAALLQARQAELTSDFPPAIAAASLAVRLARAVQDTTIETESHMEWGWALLLQGEHAAAQAQFEQALALAQRASDRRLQADGLHGLGTVCLVTGDYTPAKRYFQQVLDIASQVDIRKREASTLANLGYIATAQGEHAASKAWNERALHIHREIGDQRGAALVMENLASEFLAEGDFAAARAYLEQALVIQQEIQAQENVGVTLRSLGVLYHQLGDYASAQGYYEQALGIFNELGIRWYQGQALAFMSLLDHHLGDDRGAIQHGLQGLGIAQEIGDRLAQGWLLDALGHAQTSLGRVDKAAEAYQSALVLRHEMQDEPHLTTESLAGLARLALSQGRLADAKGLVEEILGIQKAEGLKGVNEPFRVLLSCFEVLEACQDARAGEILSNAHEELMALSAKIGDSALERTFLESVAAHNAIIAAYYDQQARRQGTQIQARLPRADAPTGRTLRADEYTTVNWTISAPEDQAISGKTERRRQRLLRLLAEAQSQGATPNYDHLAEALGVARRTIERDMLALRQQSAHLPPTRGKLSG
ncbi:MAG: tetratricopeptide repeat protein [Anaerolineales bacterium]|nr:tetratricopeptide repeat protein [Anaerolineales bacterium]